MKSICRFVPQSYPWLLCMVIVMVYIVIVIVVVYIFCFWNKLVCIFPIEQFTGCKDSYCSLISCKKCCHIWRACDWHHADLWAIGYCYRRIFNFDWNSAKMGEFTVSMTVVTVIWHADLFFVGKLKQTDSLVFSANGVRTRAANGGFINWQFSPRKTSMYVALCFSTDIPFWQYD